MSDGGENDTVRKGFAHVGIGDRVTDINNVTHVVRQSDGRNSAARAGC